MSGFSNSLAVAGGAAIGGVLRYWLVLGTSGAKTALPLGTLLVNVTGSFALGALLSLATSRGWGQEWKAFLLVGVCGGYTTFSAFSGEVVRLLQERSFAAAGVYMLLSNGLSVGACFLGLLLFRTKS